ncbi:MAG: hypothetical protein CML50_00665 [Rhodobacteraceae bacterium]|nr:hypothetical protein [Paracoccaceae bacterium]
MLPAFMRGRILGTAPRPLDLPMWPLCVFGAVFKPDTAIWENNSTAFELWMNGDFNRAIAMTHIEV